jgi:hypothetical protein
VTSRKDATTGEAIVAYVTLKVERRAVGREAPGAARPRREEDRRDRKAREHRLHPGAAEDPQRQDHARLLRDVAENRPLGDTTTLADPAVVSEIQHRAEDEAGTDEA